MFSVVVVTVVVMFVGYEKDVVLDFSADGGVTSDHIRQCGGFQDAYLIIRKGVEVKEPISVPQTFKLIDQDGIDEFPDHRAMVMILGQTADPHIHLFDCSVDGGESTLKIRIAGDVGKRHGW